jgi:hypothetical protein
MGEHCHEALPVLLKPALDVQGWHNVHRLEVRVGYPDLFICRVLKISQHLRFSCPYLQLMMGTEEEANPSCPAMQLLGTAFPSLRQLGIDFRAADLGDGDMLVGLQQCKQLSKLSLDWLWISPTAVTASAAALAQLPALRDLTLTMSSDINLAALIDQLTCLTALKVEPYGYKHVASTFSAAACNPGLQTFTLKDEALCLDVTDAEAVASFLTSCPCLTHLDLDSMDLSEGVVDAILTHGTSILKLEVGALVTSTNYSDQPSKLQSLSLQSPIHATVLQLANLPLRGVTHLKLSCDTLAQLQLPTSSVPADQLAAVLQRASANLAACPAWQAKPEQCISLQGDVEGRTYIHIVPYIQLTPETQMQLLQALAPLGGPHVRKFQGCVAESSFTWGRPQVEALGRSLGSAQLSELELSKCTLSTDFWAALDDVMPSLEVLRLLRSVTCSVRDLDIFCSRRQAGRSFSLILAPELYEEYEGAGLQDSLRAQGVTHVSVVLNTSHAST